MTYNLTTNNAVIYHKPTTMKRRRRTCANVCLLFVGTLLIGVGLAIFLWFDPMYDFLMNSAMAFNPNSEPFRVWRKNDPPLIMDIYMFNWTNPHEINEPGVKPKFQECGPYRFKEVKEKINITWNNNDTISYMHKKSYYFDAENSERPLSDIVTTINAVPLTIAYKARDYGFFSKRAISVPLSSLSTLSVTKTVGEILFDGYEESILSVLSSIPLAGIQDRFGLFYGKNNSEGTDGVFSMWTKNDEKFGSIASWNHKNQSDFFEGSCNDMKGSTGEFYPINRKRDYLELFSPELCKTGKLEYEKDVDIKGVKGYKYTARNIFDNGTRIKENACYCLGDCLPSGTLNVSSCRENSPTFLSMPHFYGADPYYINAIEGLNPTDDHEFYITLEPKSGIVIDIAARMQVNMLLQPDSDIMMYRNVPKVVMPIFYFNQIVRLEDDLAPTLVLIQKLPEISNYASLILVVLGLLTYVWIGLNLYCCCNDIVPEEKIPQNNFEEIPLRNK